MEDKKNNGWVQKLLLLIATTLVFSYGLIIQFVDIDSVLVGGPKYLMVEDNHIILPINKKFSSLGLFFTEPVLLGIDNKIYIEKNGEGKKVLDDSKYKISSSSDNKVITINLNYKFDSTLFIDINFAGLTKGGFYKKRYIENIDIDTRDVSLSKFYNVYIDTNKTNLSYFKSLDLRNISTFLAENYGTLIFMADLWILISVFSIQFVLLFVTIIYSIIKQSSVKIGDDAIFPIKYIDMMARDFAVILGFFGTVVSIWTALEISQFDYSNFSQILGMIKIAVFTTVLGLGTRITYGIREFFFTLN
ncbi:MAG: hypothetical protein JRC89_09310 [Deltaproteobacteria bacterium]|nr:hypothetical protein [Deltaproteobacteria bacterium]